MSCSRPAEAQRFCVRKMNNEPAKGKDRATESLPKMRFANYVLTRVYGEASAIIECADGYPQHWVCQFGISSSDTVFAHCQIGTIGLADSSATLPRKQPHKLRPPLD